MYLRHPSRPLPLNEATSELQPSIMATPTSYTIVRLPKSHTDPPTWRALIARQKTLRLRALLTSPEAFGSTYERELAFADADWETRMRNPAATTLVAVAPRSAINANDDHHHSDTARDTAYLDGEWAGSIVLVGAPNAYGSILATFEINALFVVPEARGAGLGAQLIERAVSEARELAPDAGMIMISALVVRGNERVLGLYERTGFENRDVEFVGGKFGEAWVLVREVG